MPPKVCLISPPSRSINHFRPPVGLLYLAGYLEKNGIETEIVDVILPEQIRDKNFQKNLSRELKKIEKETVRRVREIKPEVVGITCYTPEYFEALSLAREIKKFNRKIRVVVGGIHPTFYPHDFIYRGSPFDFAILGEGEVTLLELIKNLDHKSRWPKIKSIAYLEPKTQKMRITLQRPLHENLDDLASPAYHLIDMEHYTTANPYAIRGVFTRCVYVLSSRGCPSQCTFCVSKKIREFSGSEICTRLRSPKHLFEEIKRLKEDYQIDAFYFIDDLFTLNKEHVKDFCRLLIKSNMNLIWGCSSKVTTVDFETLRIMRNAGCVQIDFGVERGSNKALVMIKKGITVEIIKKVFADCRKLGIRTFANMLVNLPGETEEDLDDILKLLDEIKATVASLNVFTPYPGTEIFDTSRRGIGKKDYPDLMKNPLELIRNNPRKYKYYLHDVDLGKWVVQNSKKYNRILASLAFYLSPTYWENLWHSKRKSNYFRMVGLLIREFFLQKFS